MKIKRLAILLILLTSNSWALIFPIVSYSEDTGTILGGFTQRQLASSANLQLMAMTQKKGKWPW